MYIKCAQILLFDKYRFVKFKMMSGAIEVNNNNSKQRKTGSFVSRLTKLTMKHEFVRTKYIL